MLEYETPKMTELLFACPEDIICTSPDNQDSIYETEENGNNQDIFRKKNPVEKLTGLLK